jgi:hypothetical protein
MPEIYTPEVVPQSRRRKLAIWAGAIVAVLACATALFLKFYHPKPHLLPPSVLEGSVLINDEDTQKQQPIAKVQVVATSGTSTGEGKTNEIGFFHIVMRPGVPKGAPVTLSFQHPDYKPLVLEEISQGRLLIARLVPLHQVIPVIPKGPVVDVANVVVRYSVQRTTTVNTGSAVKTFQVVNVGNIPCAGVFPCSPDGRWRAAVGNISLDAGPGNEFQNARVSCISGPCAFTRIESNTVSDNGRKIEISALNWSDTTTFLVEAEVVRAMLNDLNLELYPVIFDQALNFNLPPTAQGLSIEANVNTEPVVFPIGPALCLTWATCNVSVAKDQTKSYRCELKPGFRFAPAQ